MIERFSRPDKRPYDADGLRLVRGRLWSDLIDMVASGFTYQNLWLELVDGVDVPYVIRSGLAHAEHGSLEGDCPGRSGCQNATGWRS
jgi:hypothetical protein